MVIVQVKIGNRRGLLFRNTLPTDVASSPFEGDTLGFVVLVVCGVQSLPMFSRLHQKSVTSRRFVVAYSVAFVRGCGTIEAFSRHSHLSCAVARSRSVVLSRQPKTNCTIKHTPRRHWIWQALLVEEYSRSCNASLWRR